MNNIQTRIQWIIDTYFDGNRVAFARSISVTEGAVRAWLTGRSQPRQNILEHMAEVTGIKFAWIDSEVGTAPTPENVVAEYSKFNDAQKGAFHTRLFQVWNERGHSFIKAQDRTIQIILFRKMIHGSIEPTAQQIEFVFRAGYRFQWVLTGEGPKMVGAEQEQPESKSTIDRISILAPAMLQRHTFTHESIEESITLPVEGSYGFRVPDDSMTPKYNQGTIVIAHPDDAPEYRQFAIVKIGEQILVREWRRFGEKILLRAVNPAFDDLLVDPTEIEFAHRIAFAVED